MRLLRTLCLALGVLALAGCEEAGTAPPWGTASPLVGHRIDDVVLERLTGGGIRVADLRGRVLVINLWATWCPPCRAEMPALQALADGLPADKVAVMGVSVDTNAFFVAEYLRERDLRFAAWFDHNGDRILPRFGLGVLPATLVIGPDGIVRGVVTGYSDWATPRVRDALLALAS